MLRPFFPLLPILCLTIAPARGDDAASTKQIFDSLYGPRLKQVAGTIDRADDLTLAKDMLGVAKTSTNTPALLTLLCESAHDLGMKHADGYATADEAMTLLADTVAEKRAAARDKLVIVLTKQSTAGKPDERDAAGEKLIDTLLAMGDEKMEAKKWSEAAGDYRKALATATGRKSPRVEPAKASLDAATYRDRTEKQVARLQEKILKDATDSVSAEELVRLYILELDDAAAAKPYLDRVKDEKLRVLAGLAAKDATALSESECLELGEWFAANAEKTPALAKHNVLHRAQILLERFLSLHTANDGPRVKAQVRLTEVKKSLASSVAPAKRLSLIELVDPSRDTVNGDWEVRNGKLRIIHPVTNGRISIPVAPSGDYVFEASFTATSGTGPAFVLPIPGHERQVMLLLDNWSSAHLSALVMVKGIVGDDPRNPTATKAFQIKANHSHKLVAEIKGIGKDQIAVTASVDGRKLISWKGDAADLSLHDLHKMPNLKCPGVYFYDSVGIIEDARITARSGTIERLR